jgi:hypothetical protein
MEEPEHLNKSLVYAIGQLAAVMATHLHRQGVVSPNTLAEGLGMMSVLSENDPEAGIIVAYWASVMEDLAATLELPPPEYPESE